MKAFSGSPEYLPAPSFALDTFLRFRMWFYNEPLARIAAALGRRYRPLQKRSAKHENAGVLSTT
jgi:hypothetical protein